MHTYKYTDFAQIIIVECLLLNRSLHCTCRERLNNESPATQKSSSQRTSMRLKHMYENISHLWLCNGSKCRDKRINIPLVIKNMEK